MSINAVWVLWFQDSANGALRRSRHSRTPLIAISGRDPARDWDYRGNGRGPARPVTGRTWIQNRPGAHVFWRNVSFTGGRWPRSRSPRKPTGRLSESGQRTAGSAFCPLGFSRSVPAEIKAAGYRGDGASVRVCLPFPLGSPPNCCGPVFAAVSMDVQRPPRFVIAVAPFSIHWQGIIVPFSTPASFSTSAMAGIDIAGFDKAFRTNQAAVAGPAMACPWRRMTKTVSDSSR